MEFRSSICKSFCINGLHVKRQKSDDAGPDDLEKDKDLMYLTFINHKNTGNVQCIAIQFVLNVNGHYSIRGRWNQTNNGVTTIMLIKNVEIGKIITSFDAL